MAGSDAAAHCRRRRPGRADGGGTDRAGGAAGRHPRRKPEPGAQIPACRPRRTEPHPFRAARSVSCPLRRRRARGCGRRSRSSRPRRCAPGPRSSVKRPSLARAGACSRRASRRRRSCAPGSGVSASSGSSFVSRSRFVGFGDGGALRFAGASGEEILEPRAAVFALGGGSWPRLGSDGGWVEAFRTAGIEIAPLKPANCGFVVEWSARIRDSFAGAPLKNVALSAGGVRARGEAVVTRAGVEGGAVYALSARLRDTIAAEGAANLAIDFKPDVAEAALAARLERKPGNPYRLCCASAPDSPRSRSRSCAKPAPCRRAPRPSLIASSMVSFASSPLRRSPARSRVPAASNGARSTSISC